MPLLFLVGCRQETTKDHKAPIPADLNVEQSRRDSKKDNKPLPVELKAERAGSGSKKDEYPIPSDLKIVAQFGPRYSHWDGWICTITGDGKVTKELFSHGDRVGKEDGVDEWKRQTKLSKKDLRVLLAKIKEADFCELRKEYSSGVIDSPSLVLTITENKRTHKVSVDDYGDLKRHHEVKRFLRVWSEILRKVSSPNPEQKPELYEPLPSKSGKALSDQEVR